MLGFLYPLLWCRVDVTNLKICVCIYHLLQWQDMEEGKVSSHHDLLSIMISTVDQDQLATNEDIKDNILLFLFAGHDTSVSTLAGVLKYLFLNPQCLQQVIKGKNMF